LQRTDPSGTSGGGRTRATQVDRAALLCMLAVPLALTFRFLPYYIESPAARVRDTFHHALRPAGPVGLSFGILGLAMFVFMWLYPLRKRVKRLKGLGAMGQWLRIHVLVGLALPVVVAVHASWQFRGLIGLGYAAMTLVILSGIIGRYIYSHIPRQRNGLELTRDEVTSERRALLTTIAAESGLDPSEIERTLTLGPAHDAGPTARGALARMIADDLARRRALAALRRLWSHPQPDHPAPDPQTLKNTIRLARREIALNQQVRMLEATQRVFGWWHVAHLPVAITAVIAILVHVLVAVLVGGVLVR
jgi:hypothetical protein